MRVAREFVNYLSRELAKRLVENEFIEAPSQAALAGWIHQAMQEEFAVEDRINEEARAILAEHAEQMQRFGASYGEAFKKIKAELARKHKVVL